MFQIFGCGQAKKTSGMAPSNFPFTPQDKNQTALSSQLYDSPCKMQGTLPRPLLTPARHVRESRQTEGRQTAARACSCFLQSSMIIHKARCCVCSWRPRAMCERADRQTHRHADTDTDTVTVPEVILVPAYWGNT